MRNIHHGVQRIPLQTGRLEAPGVGCDVPAHSYIFPFEPNPNWSKCDADGAEIDKCIVDTVDKYGLKEPIVFDTKLVKSIWNQERCKWALELKQNDKIIHDEADFLTNGSGILNQWKMPGIAGLNQFTGKLVHTAAWDKAYDWTNEKIAVLGNGSSEHNKLLFDVDAISGLMRQHLSENPDLTDKLIPKFEIGCRRLNAGGGYLEALQQPNAEWCFEGIDKITKADIRTAAGEEEFDWIWKETPEAYFSICAGGGIANYFMFNGPNCPIGHGSVPQMISWTANYMLKWTKKIAREDIKSVVVNDSAVRNYNRQAIENIRGEEFDIRYNNSSDPASYLGNGELAWERGDGADLAFYLK
ncbi:hypothetical protein PEX1_028480 [Penicillium expansum]|uniref:Uncharacterized protein n=1 Tax=Penicillium expansum TaxID=27334 RepID=A0A0A2JH27_PENEN|nr:hypothetical protein PEX2_071650 [Penicillium expansum]KGO38803.1 hypothetical protein PEXP_097510 [Penicillium expansum]KGO47087.1 hypothetical protein PEX1_028480 [Penicillium expansum]KGO54682.1 hypothetical protein PEX2_071650 [Penicillium expansum]